METIMKIRTALVTGIALLLGFFMGGHQQTANAQDLPKAESARFSDFNFEKGLLRGTVEFKIPANVSDVTDYSIYFTDAKGTKIKYLGDANINKQKEGKKYLNSIRGDYSEGFFSFDIPDRTPIPSGADSFGIFAKNASGVSDTGTLVHIWDAPVELLEKIPFLDENPMRGIKGSLRWKTVPGQAEVTGYKVTYFNGTDWLPFEVPEDLLKPGKESYEIPINTDVLPNSTRLLKMQVDPITALGGNPPGLYWEFDDDISGETSGPEVLTNGTPKITRVRFTDSDPKAGVIGGDVIVEAMDGDFLQIDYSSGGTSLMYSLYFLDSSDKKIKGIVARGAYKSASGYYSIPIPSGTLIPKGAQSIGVFATLPTAEGIDFAKVDLRDRAGNDHYAQDVRFIDKDPSKESVKGVITWKASPHEEELKGYALFAGDDTEPFAIVPKGASPYSADVPEWYGSSRNGLVIKVIPVTTDGSYSYSINFNDGYAYLSDAFDSDKKFESARVDQYLKGFSDEDKRPGYLAGKLEVGAKGDYSIAGQGDIDIYFYDNMGNRLARIGHMSYNGYDLQKPLYFTIPEGTPIPEQAVYIGRSAKDEDGVTHDIAYYISDNVLTNKPVFRDVQPPESSYLYKLIQNGILTGFDDGTLRPTDKVTRAQFAVLLSRAFKLQAGSEAIVFPDVHPDDWYAEAVAAAVKHNLLQGYEDGTFRPNQTLTKKEMYIILYRLRQERDKKPTEQDASYIDLIVKGFKGGDRFPGWLKPAIAQFYLDRVVYQYEDLKIDDEATRDDVATVLGRFL
jgi:hypothetical protein